MLRNILIFLFFYNLPLSAQQGFVKSYNFYDSTAMSFDAMLYDNDTLILCGFIIDSMPPHKQGVLFTRIDTSGNVIDYTTHYDPSGNNLTRGVRHYPGGLIKMDDNSGYVFIGSTFQDANGFIIKLDSTGDLIWFKYLIDSTSLQGYYTSLLETETGFFIAGTKQMPTDGLNDFFLVKTDKEGSVLWEERYGQISKSDDLSTLLEINNNEYVLASSQGAGGFSSNQTKIYGVDSLGVEQWNWSTNSPFVPGEIENAGCFNLHQNELGNWIYATARYEEQQTGSWYAQAQFVVRDSNFNLITKRVYDDVDGQTNHFYNLIPLSDGDWLGLGANGENLPQPNPVIGHVYAYMARISNGGDGVTDLGDSLWTRRDLVFPDSQYASTQYLHSAVELPSGSIIAAGYFSQFGFHPKPDHGLLIKINQHGCIDNTECTPTNYPNADTLVYLTTCDSTEAGSIQYIYSDQNGEDSIVAETTTLLLAPASPVPPADLMIVENAPPFSLTIPEVPTATAYEWTVPVGVQVLSGADSTSVSIQWNDQVASGLVCVSAMNECGTSPLACTEVTVDFPDGVSEVAKKSYSIFPNPVDEILNIVFEETGSHEIVLLDMLGRMVKESVGHAENAQVVTKDLQVGTYWLKIVKREQVFWELVEVLR